MVWGEWNNGPQFQTVDVLPEAIYTTEQQSHSHQACDQQEHGEYSVLRASILVLILGFRGSRSTASDQLVKSLKQITFERDAVVQ